MATDARVVLIGDGAAFDPVRPNVSVLYRGRGGTLLVDCGFTAAHALWRHDADPDLLDAVFLTHAHGDHCFGLPALLGHMKTGGRRRPLTVVGGAETLRTARALPELAYPGFFAPERCFSIDYVEAAPGSPVALGPLTLRVAPSGHKLPNLAVRIEEEETGAVAYSGDGPPTEAGLALYRGADLLIHECYWDVVPEAKRERPGHAAADTLLGALDALGAGRIWLVHLGDAGRPAVEARVAAWAGRTPVALPGAGATFTL